MTDGQNSAGRDLTATGLARKKDSIWPDRFSDTDDLPLRVHRAISWIGRAAQETEDHDAEFIFSWIAFNAAYAQEIHSAQDMSERSRLRDFFRQLLRLDSEGRLFDAVWDMFSESIRTLLENKYVFQPFWQFHNGVRGYEDWELRFEASRRSVVIALGRSDTETVLSNLFDRLYVLRNQIIHGGATWNSSVNRDQVRDGARILSFLIPVFLDVMLDNPTQRWGPPYYPIVN